MKTVPGVRGELQKSRFGGGRFARLAEVPGIPDTASSVERKTGFSRFTMSKSIPWLNKFNWHAGIAEVQ
jgi:hypothetical protein